MKRKLFSTITSKIFALAFVLALAWQVNSQGAKTSYPNMAPVDQYLMADKNAEVALARTAAPDSISRDAEILVLTQHGYETAAKGTNGFVCLVERGWTAPINDPNFWNPKLRGAICLNPPAARTYLPITIKKTRLVFAGSSETQMFEGIKVAFEKKELPTLEPAAMCYMMSKESYLGDGNGHWHSHLMFFTPLADPASWGAGLPGSPVVVGVKDTEDRMNVFMIPVAKWSDGTPDHP
jgi:hypothetical protein